MEKDFSVKKSASIAIPSFVNRQSGQDISSWDDLVCFSRSMIFQEQLVLGHVLKLK